LGSTGTKAARRMMVKLTQGVVGINNLQVVFALIFSQQKITEPICKKSAQKS